jgi:hypothetical protein
MQRLLWFLGGLAGVLLAAGVTYAASSLSTQRIGISSEPVSAGRELAPRSTPTPGATPTPTATATPRKKKRTPAATPTSIPTAVPTVDDDNSGSDSDDDSSGRGRGRGRGRGGDDLDD